MNPQMILTAVLTYGPEIIPLIQQLTQWIKENKTEVTDADWQILAQYGSKKAADYLK